MRPSDSCTFKGESTVEAGWWVIANSLFEGFSSALKGVFVGCGRITAYSDVTFQ
jgi:hypothetical protein